MSIPPASGWTERYEALRRQAVGGQDSAGWGLTLATRQGVAAWMRAWPAETPPAPEPPATACVGPALSADLRGQITSILADMILTHQQEIPA